MQQTCLQCGMVMNANIRFCTNCGATLATPPQASGQSWQTPAQNMAQVPPWAQAQGGIYQQQQMAGMSNQNVGGSLGFGGSSDAQAKKLIKIAGLVILGAVLLFILCVTLAIVVPISAVRTFFAVIAIVLVVITWIIYTQIRRIIRRTIGSFWRFF